MVAGRLQEKNGFYYIVLSYTDSAGKPASTSSIQKMLSRILKSVNPNRKNSRHRPGITQRAGTKAASPKC